MFSLATLLNYIFNLLFDIVLIRLGRPVHVRPVWMRMSHALLFEFSLIFLTVPVVHLNKNELLAEYVQGHAKLFISTVNL